MPPSTPLVRPKQYFERRADPLPAGLAVFLGYVVGTIAFLYAIVSFFVSRIENSPPAFERALTTVLGTTIVFFFVVAIVGLLVVAAIMHYLGGGSGTGGTFGGAVAVAGWAYAPDVVSLPILYLHTRRKFGDLSLDGSDPQVLAAQLEAVRDPTGVARTFVLLGVVGWSVYILAKGTAGSHGVEVGDTIGPALLVGFGALLLSVL